MCQASNTEHLRFFTPEGRSIGFKGGWRPRLAMVSESRASRVAEFGMTTRQRLVYDVITSRKDHPSATTIHTELMSAGDRMSMATVYRQLNRLVEMGAINRVDLDNDTRYCPGQKTHAHLHCTRCDCVTNVTTDLSLISELISSAYEPDLQRRGDELCFEIQIVISGVCDGCLSID